MTDACRVARAMHVNEYNADAWATPGNVKDREMFKRDEVAISLITSEEEILFFGKTSFNTSPPKKAKVDNGDVLKRMLGETDLKASEFINR